ncbi:RNA polymerase sigma factor [Flagellimonas onchidii]|uniref:RNA polymerase sigma factor n=1 Tax=Flagellimonas onchidii TaxID=2562684 RepID=UPI0010A6544A|nr:sigma-70 family RNA polymerase sigma factor [Allomuricauda onchidii]
MISRLSHNHNKLVEDFQLGKNVKAEYGLLMEDSQLWSEFQSGNEKAFAKMYRDNTTVLYSYGIKFVNNGPLVRDCIQDLFVEIWNKKHRLGEVKSIRSYLFKSLRRKIRNEVLASKRRKTEFDYYGNLNYTILNSEEKKLIEKQEFDRQIQKLEKVMDKLTPRQREIVHLKYYSKLNYTEIAEVLNLSVKATYNLMGRAVQALRSQWIDL